MHRIGGEEIQILYILSIHVKMLFVLSRFRAFVISRSFPCAVAPVSLIEYTTGIDGVED